MFERLRAFFSIEEFMPHGHCYLWKPQLVWLHVVSDGLIGIAYVCISATLYVMVRRARLPFSTMFLAFGVFIFACGTTHLMEIYTLWTPNYWLSGVVKLVTAAASVATAFYLFPIVPKAEQLSASAKLAEERRLELIRVNEELEAKVLDRTAKLSASENHFRKLAEALAKSEAELKKAVQVRDDFLSIASHELRTPLTPIQVQLQMSRRDFKRAKEQNQTLAIDELYQGAEMSLKQVAHLSSLIDNLLDVSRIGAGKLDLRSAPMDLVETVREVTERFTPQFTQAQCRVEITQGAKTLVGEWDKPRIEQVVTNLLTNAIKYGASKPIQIEMHESEGMAVISVIDRGIGIAPDKLHLIFNRFERATSHRNISGLGLGLYIARQIVESHGGRITVRSELGQGSTFQVELPLRRTQS